MACKKGVLWDDFGMVEVHSQCECGFECECECKCVCECECECECERHVAITWIRSVIVGVTAACAIIAIVVAVVRKITSLTVLSPSCTGPGNHTCKYCADSPCQHTAELRHLLQHTLQVLVHRLPLTLHLTNGALCGPQPPL